MPAHGELVLCRNPGCRHEVGRLYRIDDDLFALQVGSLIIREGHSMFCAHCGQSVHWSMSDQKLEKLIRNTIIIR